MCHRGCAFFAMILLWGIPSDTPLRAVERALQGEGISILFLDQRAAEHTTLRLKVDERVSGALTVFDQTIELEDIRAVYARPYEPANLGIAAGSPLYQHVAALHEAFCVWLDITPAFVPNRPRAMTSNASKPYQAALIEAAGLRTPETLLTTDREAAAVFRAHHGEVMYKSISAVRSIVSRIRPEDEDRMRDVKWCPTQFQRRIGGFEVRVHLVDGEVFASRIISDADDYRYAEFSGQSLDIVAFELPAQIADRCRHVATALGYAIAGFDLRCEAGEWICFEVNPSPSFTYYEERTGQPISRAVARLLANAVRNNRGLVPNG